MNIEVTWVGIIVAIVVSMVVGFLWYSPFLLGKPWMKESGLTPEKLKAEQKQAGIAYGLSAVLALPMAYILNHVIVLSVNFYHYSNLSTGLISAFWMWLGFVMPVQATGTLFGNKKWKLFAINTSYQLASILAMGAAIGYFMK